MIAPTSNLGAGAGGSQVPAWSGHLDNLELEMWLSAKTLGSVPNLKISVILLCGT